MDRTARARTTARTLPSVACAGLLLALGVAAALAPSSSPADVFVPDSGTAGVWDGTWRFTSRERHLAVWMRTNDGKPEVKLQYENELAPEKFVTDWDGKASFYSRDAASSFELRLTHGDADRIEGTWSLEVPNPGSPMSEKGSFVMYRTGNGRYMTMRFTEYEFTSTQGGRTLNFTEAPVFILNKVSKRLVLWDEISF